MDTFKDRLSVSVSLAVGSIILTLFILGMLFWWPFLPYIIAGVAALVLIAGVRWYSIHVQVKRLPLEQERREALAMEHQHTLDREHLGMEREKHHASIAVMLRDFELKTHQSMTQIRADENGYYPYLARPDGGVIHLPNPHHQYRIAAPAPAEAPQQDPTKERERQLPPPVDVADLLQIGAWIPSRDHLFLAMTAEGPLSVAYRLAWHIALAGSTGGGKTNELRLILAQMVQWYEVYYISPPFAPIKANGEDWRPIAKRLAGPVARKAGEIEYRLQWTVMQLQGRQEQEHAGDFSWHGHPIFVVVDEYKEVIARYPGAPDDVANLLRQARQYEIFVVVAAQDFLIKNIGGDMGARDCYRTALYFGGDPNTCRSLLDVKGTLEYEQDLGKEGHMVVRTKSTQTSEARAPFMSNRAVYMLLEWPDDPILDDQPITSSAPVSSSWEPVPGTGASSGTGTRASSSGTLPRRGFQSPVEPVEQGSGNSTEVVPSGTQEESSRQFTPEQELQFVKLFRTKKSIRGALAAMKVSYGRYQKCASRIVEEKKLRNA